MNLAFCFKVCVERRNFVTLKTQMVTVVNLSIFSETKETDGFVQNDQWLSFDAEQTSSLEKYIHHR